MNDRDVARASVKSPHIDVSGRLTATPGDRRCEGAAGAAPPRASIPERRHGHHFLASFYRAFPHEESCLVQDPEADAIPAIPGEEGADSVNDDKDVGTALRAMNDCTCRPVEDGGGHGRDSEDTEDDEVPAIVRPRHRRGEIAGSSPSPQPL